VLEYVPALGRRVVDRRRLGRAHEAIHEEGDHGHHQDAGDGEGHGHLDQGHSMRGLPHENHVVVPAGLFWARNHEVEVT
jgi:hypothetical protein